MRAFTVQDGKVTSGIATYRRSGQEYVLLGGRYGDCSIIHFAEKSPPEVLDGTIQVVSLSKQIKGKKWPLLMRETKKEKKTGQVVVVMRHNFGDRHQYWGEARELSFGHTQIKGGNNWTKDRIDSLWLMAPGDAVYAFWDSAFGVVYCGPEEVQFLQKEDFLKQIIAPWLKTASQDQIRKAMPPEDDWQYRELREVLQSALK